MADFRVFVPASNGYASAYENPPPGRYNVGGEGERGASVSIFNSAGVQIAGPFYVNDADQWRGDIVIDKSMIQPAPSPNPYSATGLVHLKAEYKSPTGEDEYKWSFYVL
ncbi:MULTISPECIES: hypothetical protein [unclassified Pseudomonas]|uniref:hypothetical protein n=1 Tax=unclassified Pseudomonas TaxID=196821 RepID=UPI001F5A9653|nr:MULTISPECIES: hypothetical protein [unclassified Pseudomonas]